MKLIDFLTFEPLDTVRRKMGAQLVEYEPLSKWTPLTPVEVQQLATGGIDVTLDDVKVLPDHTLEYKGQRVVLYIRDVASYQRHDVDMPKFHVADCSTLATMRERGRFNRYVVASRHDGKFEVNIKKSWGGFKKDEATLCICQNCLNKLGWDGFGYGMAQKSKQDIVSQFLLSNFFKKYPSSVIQSRPRYSDYDAPLNEYTTDFAEVAAEYKVQCGWKCEECGLELSSHRRFLHAHHVNALKHDNSRENMRMVCLGCHANEPSHSHMKNTLDYKAFIQLFGKR
ncbi:MAG: HNH endonuclease [Phycisphaerae bacterium]|nr:HNH endonuclease [Phycisphaerae bacterium]